MELHGTDERHLDLVRKLKRTFHLIHLHFNNYACGERWYPLPAWAYIAALLSAFLAAFARRPAGDGGRIAA